MGRKVKHKQPPRNYFEENNISSKSNEKSWQSRPMIAKAAIYGLAGYVVLQGIMKNNNEGVINDVLYVPIIEEIFFRGILTEGIRATQYLYNYIYKKENLTDTDIKTQERFRVNFIAGIFGFTHTGLANQFFHYLHLGRATGYLKEQTGSLFAPLALHIAHNLLSTTRDRYSIPEILSSHHYLYIPLFIALNKKFFPIPDRFIPNFVSNTTAKIRNFFSNRFKTQNA